MNFSPGRNSCVMPPSRRKEGASEHGVKVSHLTKNEWSTAHRSTEGLEIFLLVWQHGSDGGKNLYNFTTKQSSFLANNQSCKVDIAHWAFKYVDGNLLESFALSKVMRLCAATSDFMLMNCRAFRTSLNRIQSREIPPFPISLMNFPKQRAKIGGRVACPAP